MASRRKLRSVAALGVSLLALTLPAWAEEPSYRSAEAALRRNDTDTAERLARDALRAAPDDAPLHRLLGRILHRQRRYPEAEAEYRKAIELDPHEAHAYLALLYLHSVTHEAEKALATYRQISEAVRSMPPAEQDHMRRNWPRVRFWRDDARETLARQRIAMERQRIAVERQRRLRILLCILAPYSVVVVLAAILALRLYRSHVDVELSRLRNVLKSQLRAEQELQHRLVTGESPGRQMLGDAGATTASGASDLSEERLLGLPSTLIEQWLSLTSKQQAGLAACAIIGSFGLIFLSGLSNVFRLTPVRLLTALALVALALGPLAFSLAYRVQRVGLADRRRFQLAKTIEESREIKREAHELGTKGLRLVDVVEGLEFCPEVSPASDTSKRWRANRVLRELPAFKLVQRVYDNRLSKFRRIVDLVQSQIDRRRKEVHTRHNVGSSCSRCKGAGTYTISYTKWFPCSYCGGKGWALRIHRTEFHDMARFDSGFFPADAVPGASAERCPQCRGGRGFSQPVSRAIRCRACTGTGITALPPEGKREISEYVEGKVAQLKRVAEGHLL